MANYKNKTMIKKMILGMLAVGFFATSCSNDDDVVEIPLTSALTVDFSGLEVLGSNFVYEGWIIVEGAPVSTGTFTSVEPQTFQVNTQQLVAATRFVLSIEPLIDTDPAPAPTKVLVGDFAGSTANLTTSIVGDFSNASGTFFLRTPTDEVPMSGNNGNDEYGVWYGAPGMPPTAGLNLPALTEASGFIYEGWVIGESGPISTGQFHDFGDRDDFTNFSGMEFGETFPLDVRGRMVVISVEPFPDDSPAPFAMKPLVGTAGMETAPATHDFGQNLMSLPTGSVSR